MARDECPFQVIGSDRPVGPILISVPHAGREYPPELAGLCRHPLEALIGLEDRFADLLIDDAVAGGTSAVVARRARAWIDLNRDPREIDPGMVASSLDPGRAILSIKVRGGLGLVPRRLPALGELWNRRLTAAEIQARLDGVHAPYHRTVALLLAAMRRDHGHAVLIDCHSMPALPRDAAGRAVDIVVGDRFGRSANDDIVDCALMAAEAHGLRAVRNAPYAGGYTLDRHGSRRAGVHAIQLEFARALYLDGVGQPVLTGLDRCRSLLADVARRLSALLSRQTGLPVAAE
jgi:N-formylglutamate amidohydrolase